MRLLKETFNAWENLLLFVPYYFSTPLLIKTFFSPWKRQLWSKTQPGFHPAEAFFRLSSNLLSRVIGALLRSLMIFAGLFTLISLLFFGPPLLFLFSLLLTFFPSSPPLSLLFDLKALFSLKPKAADWHFGYTPNLDKYLKNSNIKAQMSKLIGREKEIAQIKRIFSRERENNVLLVGEPGSGRHAILQFLPKIFVYQRFVNLDLVSLFKDKKTPQQRRGALEEILSEAAAAGNIVLIIDNFEKYVDFSDIWEKFIGADKLYLIAVTTPAEYQQKIFPNKTLMKYFTKVEVSPLSRDQIFKILKLRLAQLLPRRPPQLTSNTQLLPQILEASSQTALLEDKHQPEAALDLLEEFISYYKASPPQTSPNISLNRFLEEKLKSPAGAIKQKEKEKLTHLEELLHRRLVNQEEAVREIAASLRRRRLHLSSESKPIGSFLFLGPSGVGKTETAKALSEIFFESKRYLLRFDMARYQDKSQVKELLEQLARQIREQPYGVLLLDEIEKAHPHLLNLFLTIIDEGYFHDRENIRVPCQNLIIIATSNAAGEFIREEVAKGFIATTRKREAPPQSSEATLNKNLFGGGTAAGLPQTVINYILRHHLFTPEFINRFDAVVVYKPLTEENLKQIAQMKLEKLQAKLQKKQQKTFEITEELLEQIVKEGTHPEFGAREIERTIKRLVEDRLAQQLLA